jgi:LAS superfamily LD-carboxypeptidase LdcB
VVNGQDKNAIITKTNDLTSKANEVFAKAEPSEDPQEEGIQLTAKNSKMKETMNPKDNPWDNRLCFSEGGVYCT